MTTPKSHKARGKGFETDLLKWLRAKGYSVERLALAGSRDEGDLVISWGKAESSVFGEDFDYTIIECKSPGAGNKISLSAWLAEADVEMENYGRARNFNPEVKLNRLLIIKAYGKPLEDAYVVQRLKDLL